MALPSLSKTWRFKVGTVVVGNGTIGTQNGNLLIAIKDALIGAGVWTDSAGAVAAVANPWTVVLSNGRVNGLGGAGVDQWTSATQVTWTTGGTGNLPWMLLQNAAGVQVLISTSVSNSDTTLISVRFSVSGAFAGGTATALPTAADSVSWSTGGNWGATSTASRNQYVHVLHSTDGLCTRVFVTQGAFPAVQAVCTGTWHMGAIKNPKAALVVPFQLGIVSSGSSAEHAITGSGGFLNGASSALWIRHGASIRCTYTTEGAGDGLLPQMANQQSDFDGSWPATPLGVFGITTGGRGRIGEAFDVWSSSWTNQTGDCFPDSGGPGIERQFIQLGWLLYPWNGSQPQLTGGQS